MVGDRNGLVPRKQHRKVPGKEVDRNWDHRREGLRVLCSQAGPVSEPVADTLKEPGTNRASSVAMMDTIQLLREQS